MKEKHCPCCPNHCDSENLSCHRGMEYFGKSNESRHSHSLEKEESAMTIDEKVLSKIKNCGHLLHHSRKEISVDFLTEEEKEKIIILLSKCLDNWK